MPMGSKADARKRLQRMLSILRADLEHIESFAIENKLEFSFLGMKYFLKDPSGSNRWAKKGIFIPENIWKSSSWGCGADEDGSHERFSAWEDKYFPYQEDSDE